FLELFDGDLERLHVVCFVDRRLLEKSEVVLPDELEARGLDRKVRGDHLHEFPLRPCLQRRVEAAFETDLGTGLRTYRLAARGAGKMSGINLHGVIEREQFPPDAFVQELAAAVEIGPAGVSDEEGVACQSKPGLLTPRRVAHQNRYAVAG